MTHRARNGVASSSQTNGQPPPSTIAAQLVEQHHQTRTTGGRLQQESRATFLQLLEEIKASPAEIDVDVYVNHKLIHVIVEAGLDSSKNDDPFTGDFQKIKQLIACLDVIDLIVKRNPYVLFVTSDGESSSEPPLCSWLLPRLFSILDQYHGAQSVVDRIQALLASYLTEWSLKPTHWEQQILLIRLYKACAEDAISVLEDNNSTSDSSLSRHLLIPSAETFALFSLDGRQPITLQRDCQVQVSTLRYGLYIVLTTINAFLDALRNDTAFSATSICSNVRAWVVKLLFQVWRKGRAKNTPTGAFSSLSNENILFVIRTLRRAAIETFHSDNCMFTIRKSASLLVRVTATVLSQDFLEFTPPAIEEVSKCLLSIKKLCESSEWVIQEANYYLAHELEQPEIQDTQKIPEELRHHVQALAMLSRSIPDKRFDEMQASENEDEKTRDGSARPNKRRKHQHHAPTASRNIDAHDDDHLFERLTALFGDWNINDLKKLPQACGSLFKNLPEQQKLEVLHLLIRIPCASSSSSSSSSSSLHPVIQEQKDSGMHARAARSVTSLACECQREKKGITRSEQLLDQNQWDSIVKVLESLLESQPVQASKKFRVMAMNAVKRIASHSPNPRHRDLTVSMSAKWCLQSLRSSSREVRIAAGYTLPAFLGTGLNVEDAIAQRNRVLALDALRTLGGSSDPRYCESAILAFGHLARHCGDEEINITVLQLVEYLGSTNPLVCSLAQLELRNLAQAASLSLQDFIRPFWRTVGVTIVKDLLVRPQKAQNLSDLLGIGVDQLLLMTQSEVLPYLILWRRQDLIQRLVKASGDESSLWDLCMQSRNLTAILSLLLAQPSADREQSTLAALAQICSQFKDEDVSSLFKLDPIAVACELLISAGEANGEARKNILDGFKDFTLLVERKGQQSRTSSAQNRLTSKFFENHTLGIMATFSDIIDNPGQSHFEKKSVLRAIQQMISVARGHVRIALPQIRACLDSAMLIPQLCDQAFGTWITLLEVLEQDEDLEILVDHIFTAIVQNWNNLTASTQEKVYNAVATLMREHGSLIQDDVASLPSLSSIPIMSKFESHLSKLRATIDVGQRLRFFSRRCRDENSTIVLQGLRELLPYLEENQNWIHESIMTEQPNAYITVLERTLMDVCVKFNERENDILELCAQCLGVIGCLDPNRLESARETHDFLPLSNFVQASEAVEFVVYLLEHVLLKAFHSVSNPRAQGFLAYVMQELLKFCGFSKEATSSNNRPHDTHADDIYQRWRMIPETIRNSLTPFVSSRYVLTTNSSKSSETETYPIYTQGMSHGIWLRNFVYDLLQKAKGDNAQMFFTVVSRVIRGYDIAIASFLLPFILTNVIVGGTESEMNDIATELTRILDQPIEGKSSTEVENLKLCSENVFQVLDYLSRWVQAKKKSLAAARSSKGSGARSSKIIVNELEEVSDLAQISSVERILSGIPPDVVARRALQCKSYARALLHWEQHFRRHSESEPSMRERYYESLQDIYSQIDEPDGLEGISAYLQVLSPEQQLLEHRRAGRWMAAQSWYETKLMDEPGNIDHEVQLLECFQQAGQHRTILDRVYNLSIEKQKMPSILSIATEAAWSSDRWSSLGDMLSKTAHNEETSFNVSVGRALLAVNQSDEATFQETVKNARLSVARTLSNSTTSSLQACHGQLLKLHALYEIELLTRTSPPSTADTETHVIAQKRSIQDSLNSRLNIMGTFVSDKQYLLSIRRAAMKTRQNSWSDAYCAASWMTTAKIARKNNSINVAYEAVINASRLGDDSAMIEQARLLWKEGKHRKAIQSLQGAIAADAFGANNQELAHAGLTATDSAASDKNSEQNLLVAKATLLLATWLDQAGQTQSSVINKIYQDAYRAYGRWEKGVYKLGRYYNKLLEAEKALPVSKQTAAYLSGQTTKLVVENYLRSLIMGCKYLYESLPKLLTLWLDFGIEASKPVSKEASEEVRVKATKSRPMMLDTMNSQVKKYKDKISPYVFYTALAQMITRISHDNPQVFDVLASIIIKVVGTYPQQGLWSLLAVVKSSSTERSQRGSRILTKIKEKGRNVRNEGQSIDLKSLVAHAQKLSDQLLYACMAKIDAGVQTVSLERHLKFNLNLAPCPLVVPLERTLTASLPTVMNVRNMMSHKAFPMTREAVTISSFIDEVVVLSSLQRPRKITVRGSDGRKYGLLCKPNDDLRKDQRLMEFNAMINRSLKKDAESSKRRLYIKTYAVTPLNESCGIIEWVDGLKPIRDLLVNIYRSKGTAIDYNALRELTAKAQKETDGHLIFTNRLLKMYPPVLHEWFAEMFPEPETWFAARLRYTRSCAVASMVGHVLGLGDRHGENVLLEEESGGVFHVDFNCLFEKGLTFDYPELVPFRLTHNMVDAFGAYGVEGPFRRSAECAMSVMRANEDALLTILETFVYDPTQDFVGPRKRHVKGVPETPKDVLESVRSKVRGLMHGESVPLSVEGHVDALIKQATDPKNLCMMYIGWCAFF